MPVKLGLVFIVMLCPLVLEAARVKHRARVARRANSTPVAQSGVFVAKVQAVNQRQPTFPGNHGRITTALALSGGGSRAMSWAMGVLRALDEFGLMDRFDAVSSVSGGGWAASVYMFQTKYNMTELLGPPTIPGELTLEELSSQRGRLNDVLAEGTNSRIAWCVLIHPWAECWERMIEETILAPFDLGGRDTYLAADSAHRADIIRRNPQLREDQFRVPRPDRPKVLVMNGILTAPVNYPAYLGKAVPFQVSPDFAGTPFWPNYTGSVNAIQYPSESWFRPDIDAVMGGGLIETFAYGGRAPSSQSQSGEIPVPMPDTPMSLASAVAISSGPVIKSQRYVWPILPEGQTQEALLFEHADGGMQENSALLALLQRRATKAVSVMATGVALSEEVNWCESRTDDEWEQIIGPCDKAACMLTSLFGYKYEATFTNHNNNQVFAKDTLPPLLCRFQHLKRLGKPAVLVEKLEVVSNSWFGIDGGFEIELLFIVLDASSDFERSLPAQMQAQLESNSLFAEHPHYDTFMEWDLIHLQRPISNLLAAQSEYFVKQNQGLLHDFLR